MKQQHLEEGAVLLGINREGPQVAQLEHGIEKKLAPGQSVRRGESGFGPGLVSCGIGAAARAL